MMALQKSWDGQMCIKSEKILLDSIIKLSNSMGNVPIRVKDCNIIQAILSKASDIIKEGQTNVAKNT